MHIITNKKLSIYWHNHPDAEGQLKDWIRVVERSAWRNPQEIKDQFGPTVSILSDNRCRFEIKGNDHRLIVKIHYNSGKVFIRFIGTHAEYDKINAETI